MGKPQYGYQYTGFGDVDGQTTQVVRKTEAGQIVLRKEKSRMAYLHKLNNHSSNLRNNHPARRYITPEYDENQY